MPIVNARRRELFRTKFQRLVHNKTVRVRVKIDEQLSQPNPNMKGTMEARFGILTGFECSVFSVLSGKLSRIFRTRLDWEAMVPGLWDASEWIVQWVPNLYNIRTTAGLATNAAPSAVTLEAAEDFLATFVKVGAKVTNVTDGSTALVTAVAQHALTVDGLTGGTNNLFTLGDDYTVDNNNDLVINDQVEIDDKWWTVLAVIPDSEGIQRSALLGD